MADRPYIFFELTNALCSKCMRKVEAKVVIQDGRVYMHKFCPEHRAERVLVSTDADYYQFSRRTLKPGQMPIKFHTEIERGCPFDCGLCPDHEQHSCVALVEITDHCNLTCPVCYADSSPRREAHRSLEQIAFMLDAVVRSEGNPDVVQISGGEPTIHPDFFAILDLAKARPIKHLMLNTNGIRIAREPAFARRLAEYRRGFEVYLQFDSLDAAPQKALRGADLTEVHNRALDALDEHGISTTLVVTLKKGLNDDQIGAIIDFALSRRCVRGITFQPIQAAGRVEGFDHARDRLTLSEVRSKILEQSPIFQPKDVVPVPCHPDCLAMAYALKLEGKVIPLTQLMDPTTLLELQGNTVLNEQDPRLRKLVVELFSTSHSPDSSAWTLRQLLCCLPEFTAPPELTYDKVFRILIVQFMDVYSMDVRSVKKSCLHIVHPDGRMIPFDTYNLFYRDRDASAAIPDMTAGLPLVQIGSAGGAS
ncbi:Antilisterial bacteriocin subtilosin biosynthesis protein AlbA [Aquisphaera giovannonii]|uniref:Antilisterial bacteriocin subtilosin biosynthesis protein AlbA n=1 Tax=Aquisphaera giovannonii TaxID=406548 RepID=A0A5B9WGH5_9BACT|nr:radical SAM protein [Aquisphaera giovannonii]QEH39111.1 Antilisterial bacteriocin subtilosin biosynthesis protein AlbA [Aquisphaera giovannonii]